MCVRPACAHCSSCLLTACFFLTIFLLAALTALSATERGNLLLDFSVLGKSVMVQSIVSCQVRSQGSISIVGGIAGEEGERGRAWRRDCAWDQ